MAPGALLPTFLILTVLWTAEPVDAGRVIVIVADKLAVEDLVDFPEATASLWEAAAEAGVAIMNVRTAGSATSANGYLSLALGQRTTAGLWSAYTLSLDEVFQGRPAQDVFTSLTGKVATGEAFHLGIGELKAAARSNGAIPGALGDTLARAGKFTALVGNGDRVAERVRFGGLLAMDQNGFIPFARIDADVITDDPSWPTQLRTDYDATRQALWHLWERAELVIVDLADLARLEAMATYLEPAHARGLRATALQRISTFVHDVARRLDALEEPTHLYLIAPSPPRAFGREGILTTPIFRWQSPPQPGLLTSATTRRPGIVANTDFLPSILEELDVAAQSDVAGRPWHVLGSPKALDHVIQQYETIRTVHLQRLPVLQPYFFIVLGTFAVGATLTVATRRGVLFWNHRINAVWKGFLAALAALPLGLLLLTLFPPAPLGVTAVRLIVLIGILAASSALLAGRHPWHSLGVIAVATVVVVSIDIVAGAPLMQGSLLGYDPVAGSRYYGVGNEYMGVLIGAALLGSAFYLERAQRDKADVSRQRKWIPGIVLGAIAVLMAHPRLGINVGGAISAAAAAVAATLFAQDQALTMRRALVWAALTFFVLLGAGLADYYLLQRDASHLGRAVAMVSQSGSDPLWDLVSRKVAINVRLIRLTIWSRVAMAALSLLGIVLWLPNWLFWALKQTHPWVVRMSRAALVSALVALVVNDSGIVAAAMLLLWPALVTLSLAVRLGTTSRSGPAPGLTQSTMD